MANRIIPILAALAFATAAMSFLLPCFMVGMGTAGMIPIHGSALVTGTPPVVPAVPVMDTVATSEAMTGGREEAGTSSADPTSRARQFLRNRTATTSTGSDTPAPNTRTSTLSARSPTAVAILVLVITGLVASLMPQRILRFTAAACAIGGLVGAALLLTGSRDLAMVTAMRRTAEELVTGAVQVDAAVGYWVLIGALAMATVLSALGLRP
ncbi:MAG TPA: hypothetical protein P5291_09060, partial [Flavobacteriales bacterium]|nr:hypothetical protein [Flavobacteriales bacterium]